MLTSIVRHLNERRDAKLEGEADAGFTLIELMVVLLIMAILLAIAIPTFLGVKGGAQDRSAQSDLNTALTNAKAYYGNNQSYGTTGAATAVSALTAGEPALKFFDIGATSPVTVDNPGVPGHVYVATSSDGNGIILLNRSQAGDCWAILTNEAAVDTTTVKIGSSTGGLDWPVAGAGTFYASIKPASSTTCDIPTTTGSGAGEWHQNSFPAAA